MNSKRTSTIVAALLLGFVSIAPASAEEALGSGLVRIDGTWATVKTLADGSSVLTLDKEATGQWMGEIGPDNQLSIREIDDERLVRAWNVLGHNGATGVNATVTWNRGGNYAALTISQPKLTARGHLRFTLSPDAALPARLSDVDINIARAQNLQTRSFPVTQNFAITSTSSTSTTLPFAYSATIALSDSGLRCFSSTVTQSAPQMQLPANLVCGSVTFNSGQYTMSLATSTQNGTVFFATTMAASGSTFSFSSIIASWTAGGNS
jgi:hypothetical protein